ncbi:MAG: amidohydrolase family protein [Cryomorphaceae bacterium]
MKSGIHIVFFLVIPAFAMAQTSGPSASLKHRTLIRYAVAHVGDGTIIDNSYIEIQNGEFTRVVDANKTRIDDVDYDTIIDAEGMHVFPGFTIMDSRLGLIEIGQVKATHDFDEVGAFLPNVRALPAFNAESMIIPTVRSNGVLMAQIAPVGGTISGSSSFVHLNGGNWQEASVRGDEGIYMNWPARYRASGWWAEPGPIKANKEYEGRVRSIHDFFTESKAYSQLESRVTKNLRFEAMRGVFSDDTRLYIRVNWARDILDVVQFVRKFKLKRVAIVGGAEAHLVTTELRENNIPVIIDRVHKLPVHSDSPVDEQYLLASRLVSAGIDVAFATSGGMEAMISRNLPFQVGTAVHYGLPYEAAIRCLTQVPAKMAGIDHNYGTLEPGKVATFFITAGDPLDMSTNEVIHAFVEGLPIDLGNHQIDLYEKFSQKHGLGGQ